MRRSFVTLALAGLLGGALLVSNAEACHKKKKACAPPPCEPVACATPAPCPPPPCYEPAPCPPPKKKCCGGGGLFKKKHRRGCGEAPATACYSGPAYHAAPAYYGGPPMYAAPQMPMMGY